MKKLNLILLLICSALFGVAQDADVRIGDTLYFEPCTGENFTYVDYYVKSRIEIDSVDYSTLEGWDFHNAFFTKGDFDVTRMPCRFSGSYAIIKNILNVQDSEEVWHPVVEALMPDNKSAAYLIEEAFTMGEVLLSPAQ